MDRGVEDLRDQLLRHRIGLEPSHGAGGVDRLEDT